MTTPSPLTMPPRRINGVTPAIGPAGSGRRQPPSPKPAEPAPVVKHGRMTPASRFTPRPVVWAWRDDDQGRVPAGALTVAAGREGTGKSSFGIWFAAKVTRGELPGAWYGTPRAAIYLAVEDSWEETIVPRLIAAGADLDLIYHLDVVVDDTNEGYTICLPTDNRLLEQAIRDYSVGLVLFDPLLSAISASIDTHNNHGTRKGALEPLTRMAQHTGAVMLGIAHFSKAAGTDAASLITGTAAFREVARSIFGFAADQTSGEKVISQVKNNQGRGDLPSLAYRIDTAIVETPGGDAEVGRFVMLGPSERTVADILAATPTDDAEEQRDAVKWLRAYLMDNGGEAHAQDVLKAGERDGFSRDVLKRAKRPAKADSRKNGMDSGWTWFLTNINPEESTKRAPS